MFGAGLVVEGEVTSHGDITIEGRLTGNILVEGQVSVAAQGVVEGDVNAQRVVVAGRVAGTIHASEGTRLVAGAKVDADVSSPRLELEDGATLNGRIDMGGKSSPGAESDRATDDQETGESRDRSPKRDVA